MNILSIDCSMNLTCTGILKDNGGILSVNKDLGRRQSRELNIMAENLLTQNNLAWQDLDYIALTNGPGYFTGLRAAAAYVKGLAYALNIKIIPVSSLELLKFIYTRENNQDSNKNLLAMIYAGHGFVYASGENLQSGEYPHALIKNYLAENPDVIIISDDASRIDFDPDTKIINVNPNAGHLAELASLEIKRAVDPMKLEILYFRLPQGMQTAV